MFVTVCFVCITDRFDFFILYMLWLSSTSCCCSLLPSTSLSDSSTIWWCRLSHFCFFLSGDNINDFFLLQKFYLFQLPCVFPKTLPSILWSKIIGLPFYELLNRFQRIEHMLKQLLCYIHCWFTKDVMQLSTFMFLWPSFSVLFFSCFNAKSTRCIESTVAAETLSAGPLKRLRPVSLLCLTWSKLFCITFTHCSTNFIASPIVLRLLFLTM